MTHPRSPKNEGYSIPAALPLVIAMVGILFVAGFGGLAGSVHTRQVAPTTARGSAGPTQASEKGSSSLVGGSPGFNYPSTMGWQNITSPSAPAGRYGGSLVYDAADGYLVLYGGTVLVGSPYPYYVSTNETWTYINGTWSNVTATAGPAPPYSYERYAHMTYDARDGYVVLLGGDLQGNFTAWKFSAGAWSALPNPPVTNLSDPIYDSTDGYTIASTYSLNCSTTGLASTYSYAAGTWTLLNASSPCLPGAYGTDDPAAGGVLYFGGDVAAYGGWTPSNHTWLFSHGIWTNLTSSAHANLPFQDEVYSIGLVYDPTVSAAVLIAPSIDGLDTWAFNGTWANETTASHPPVSSYPAFGWDGGSQSLIVFGGLRPNARATNATWQYSGSLTFQTFPPVADPAVVDEGVATALSAQFQGGNGPYNVTWTFGDGTGGIGSTIHHAYTSLGTFTVTATVNDSHALSASASTTVRVVADVGVSASASTSVTDVGLGVEFSAAASGGTGTQSYAWTFGDGTSAVNATDGHAYGSAGIYTATVWANDTGGGSSSAQLSIQVNPPLTVNFSLTPSSPSLGQLVNFTAAVRGGTTPYTLSWAFGDGGVGGNLTAISHVFTTNGPFSAAVLAVDAAGGRASYSTNLTVALNLSIIGSWALGAAPLPVAFTSHVDGGTPGYTYAWQFGDGALNTSANPTHTYTVPGTYTARLTVTDAAGRNAVADWPVFIAVGGGPLSVGVSAAPGEIAVGGSTLVTASVSGGSGGYRLAWLNGGLECTPTSSVAERCSGTSVGSHAVSAQVFDSTGSEQTGTTTLQVGTGATVGSPPGAVWALQPWMWALAGGGVAAAGVGLALRLARGGPRRRGRRAESPPPTAAGADGPDTGSDEPEDDPLSDLV